MTAEDILSGTREECFREDQRLEEGVRSTLSDYSEPIFDRGHLVPNADMNRSRTARVNSFVLSNMMPQHDQFNRGVWETLESAVRAWTISMDVLTVLSGPIFDKDNDGEPDGAGDAARVQPDDRVAIPTAFFKIVVHERPSRFIDALAIILPHTDNEVPRSWEKERKLAYLQEQIVSVDDVEDVTSLDLLADLPDI